MSNSIEFSSVEELVKDSEVVDYSEKGRSFKYELNEKAAKSKLVKGARMLPFEIVKNVGSSNLVFNLGAWEKVVKPSVKYWSQNIGDKTCKIGQTVVRVASVKEGTEAHGKHIDTQIVFYVNRDKAVCHF